MAFTDSEKTDIRRFCGFGAYGMGQPTPASGYRYSTRYGVLEYKLNTLGPAEELVVRGTYLANLPNLEKALFATVDNLDTAKAAVWTHNKNEYRDKQNLYKGMRRELCAFLGISPGPMLENAGMTLVN
jgi:hypothetical protein